MIDPKELRIGNLVNFHQDDTVFTVDEIMETGLGVHDDNENTWIELDQFSPIPITPEWLERLGFESSISPKGHENWIKYDAKHLAFVLREITPFIGFTYHSYGTDHSVELKSVHQLQNIYFALTGQELTVNK